MASITLRNVVARPLTNQEVDDNFTNLNIEVSNTTSNVGVITNLTTSVKANLVAAVNEVRANVVSISTDLGSKSSLTTPVTTSFVNAINDVYSKASSNVYITGGSIASVSSILSTGNITGSYFLGNGSLLTGISVDSTRILFGNSSVTVASNSDITAAVSGTTVMVYSKVSGEGRINVYGNLISNVVVSSNFQDSSGRTLKILDENDNVIWGG